MACIFSAAGERSGILRLNPRVDLKPVLHRQIRPKKSFKPSPLWLAIILATVLQFAFGFIWYTPIFGKIWGQIHGFDQLSKEKQSEMMRKMGPLLTVQIVGTIVTSIVLSLFIKNFVAGWHAFGIAGFAWLGFILPTQVGAVIFGGTHPKWVVTKIAIMAFGALGCMMIAATVFHFMR